MKKEYYAIIDIGSNTMRLVIYLQEKGGRLKEVENVKAVARLRTFLDPANNLSMDGINKLVSTLSSFQDVLGVYQLKEVVCVATATIRQANNKEEIITIAEKETGLPMRILSEEEEAYYGYLAVVNSTSIEEGITVDIGGGSTEVTYFKNRELIHSHSFPFGALTLKEFFTEEIPTDEELVQLHHYLSKQFHTLPWLAGREIPLIAIGGSARNLVQIEQNLKKYSLAGLHQYKMFDKDIQMVSNYLTSLSPDKLPKVEGLSKDRADIIIPAIQVFHTLYQTVQADCFILSRKGLRDGVFYEQLSKEMGSILFPNVLEDSIQELINDFNLEPKQIMHVQYLTRKVFDYLKQNGIIHLDKNDWSLVKRASYLCHLGEYIDAESSAQHTFYLLANRTIDGLMHRERLMIALIASYKNKTVFKQFIQPYKNWFLKEERKKILHLGALLKFTYCLDATKRQVVKDIHIKKRQQKLTFSIYCDGDCTPEEYQAEKQKKHLEKLAKMDVDLHFLQANVKE
ncbi:exopolyphosphatase / guanosine-5'-triphosphate,3'-diphosphate pyrophosphatase [Gracilibacillus ureilyticus]|uniref:Exopolyphosphatase / guanosine-5'-triphosphate,3'-diphosphate pyrophosphatase n=1 Tax=Gracilibacillus ureilyticus TaxID=531814 RepID=A0A1H9QE28_9BACI|nr:Ppx/GppA family phosphatase [Gracilibacillus ureilyticus]SER58063.1 exopolyphosphatase / guanosine-5'-triphosphate,3'-diphosphate pyrophosphatase [Gracilibacillus ureilyticus]